MIDSKWQHYLFAIIAQLLLPLSPVFIALFVNGGISERSLAMVAAIYCVSIGVASRTIVILLLAIIVSLMLSAAYGMLEGGTEIDTPIRVVSILVIVVFGLIYIVERFIIHIKLGEIFFNYEGGSDD